MIMMMMIFLKKFFDKYYMTLAESKDLYVLIYNKSSFDRTAKNKREAYENLVAMSRNNDYTT